MITPVIRLVVEWLADPVTGLNAQLAAVPFSDVAAMPAPAIAIYNSLDHDWVARDRAPADKLLAGPILTVKAAVSEQQPIAFPMLPQRQLGNAPEVPAQLTAILKKSASAAQRVYAELALRSALRVIAQQFPSHTTDFIRDGVVIRLGDTPAGLFTQFAEQGDDQLTGAETVPFAVLDRWALGIS